MRKKSVVLITLAASLLCMLAVSVEAQRGRRRQRPQPAAQQQAAAPQSAAIAQSLGELRWGMEPRAVHEHFQKQIRESFRIRLSKAPGTIEEERIRHDMDDQLRRLRESYVRFDGERNGWDLSFLRGEFTHGNRESMLVYRDENSQNFYFFIQGRLWKWYKAFDAQVFQGQPFAQFASAVQGRFGNAVERNGRLTEGGPEQHWLEWQDRTTRLRAIDQTRFYGFYCLVFEDKGTLGRLESLRSNTIQTQTAGSHALVESVTLPEGAEATTDDGHADIVDRITGNVRRRPDQASTQGGGQGRGAQGAPAQRGASQGSSGSSGSAGTSPRGSGRDSLSLDDL